MKELEQRADDDGSENVATKMNLRPFNLYSVDPFSLSNVGNFLLELCDVSRPTRLQH